MQISVNAHDASPFIPEDLSVYQQVVIDGQVVRQGARACEDRWKLIEPHLPYETHAILDVGSNFGWFGIRACECFPNAVVASMEADLRSAEVQRAILAAHDHQRICLLTQTVKAAGLRSWADAGQRFDAAFVLAVLHWMPDHHEVLTELGRMAQQLFIEVPEPDETAVGLEYVRKQIGRVENYLSVQFPGRAVECLGEVDSPMGIAFSRRLWRIGPASGQLQHDSVGLDVASLLPWRPSWPRRSWWEQQIIEKSHAEASQSSSGGRLTLSASGLQGVPELTQADLTHWKNRAARFPEKYLDNRALLLWRRARRAAARMCGL